MPRYFLHLRSDREEILDLEGQRFADLDQLSNAMLRAARELIAADALDGRIRLDQRIDAEDEQGAIVRSLPFTEAVSIGGQ